MIAFLENTYQEAVDKGTRILAIFTGGHKFHHNYRKQLLDALPRVKFRNQLDLHFYADCDHTFTYERHRARLLAELDRWIERVLSERDLAKGSRTTDGTRVDRKLDLRG